MEAAAWPPSAQSSSSSSSVKSPLALLSAWMTPVTSPVTPHMGTHRMLRVW